MPNWCNNSIKIKCTNHLDAKRLHALISGWTSTSYMTTDFGDGWLGNIAIGSGLLTVEDIENGTENMRCRGWLDDVSLEDDTVYIDTKTAWVPTNKLWLSVLEKQGIYADFYFTSDELGCSLLCTNDPIYYNRYFVDAYRDNKGVAELYDKCIPNPWEVSEVELVVFLRHLLCSNDTNINTLMSNLKKSDYINDVCIIKYDYCDDVCKYE